MKALFIILTSFMLHGIHFKIQLQTTYIVNIRVFLCWTNDSALITQVLCFFILHTDCLEVVESGMN